jgi:hypothetical protein
MPALSAPSLRRERDQAPIARGLVREPVMGQGHDRGVAPDPTLRARARRPRLPAPARGLHRASHPRRPPPRPERDRRRSRPPRRLVRQPQPQDRRPHPGTQPVTATHDPMVTNDGRQFEIVARFAVATAPWSSRAQVPWPPPVPASSLSPIVKVPTVGGDRGRVSADLSVWRRVCPARAGGPRGA